MVVEQAYAEPIPARMADIDPVNTASVAASPAGSIQVASSPSEVEARAFLTKTNDRQATALADASGYTVTFDKDGVTYYRARFGGFEFKNAAWNACKRAEEKENRLLRRPAVGGVIERNLPECIVSKENYP